MSVKVQKLTGSLILGEGPHWDEAQKALFFVDINAGYVHKYVPASNEWTKAKVDGGRVGFIVPVDGTKNQFIVGVERTFKIIEWDGKSAETKDVKILGTIDENVEDSTRINDGKADPRGRVFAGSMTDHKPPGNPIIPRKASFCRLDGHKITKLFDGVGISNGLTWDLKEKAMYYTDSPDLKIRRYDYDVESGEISNMKYVFDLKANNLDGIPDGTTIDENGNLWVANFNGSQILQIDPRTGSLLRKIPVPAKQVTSVVFGGDNYDVLFVTSANMGENQPPDAGCTFMITGLGVKGLPSYSFKL